MIAEVRGSIDYDESGEGASVVFVPGSCSTGAVWRPIIGIWNGQFRCVTTSLLGYGGTAERRSARDPSITHEAEVVEAVVRKAGGRVHLVGHSFGGFVALAVALRNRVALASLVILEAPAVELLRDCGEDRHYQAFREMTAAYFASFGAGDREAIAAMIDFYGGPGTFASWPARVKTYAVETTPVNILDWASAYGFALTAASLASIEMPTLIVWGSASHHAVQRSNALLREHIREATHATLEGAAHFMISTHPDQVSRLIAAHVCRAEAKSSAESDRPGLPKRPGAELQRNTTASP